VFRLINIIGFVWFRTSKENDAFPCPCGQRFVAASSVRRHVRKCLIAQNQAIRIALAASKNFTDARSGNQNTVDEGEEDEEEQNVEDNLSEDCISRFSCLNIMQKHINFSFSK
jgi:hypothetical protein